MNLENLRNLEFEYYIKEAESPGIVRKKKILKMKTKI